MALMAGTPTTAGCHRNFRCSSWGLTGRLRRRARRTMLGRDRAGRRPRQRLSARRSKEACMKPLAIPASFWSPAPHCSPLLPSPRTRDSHQAKAMLDRAVQHFKSADRGSDPGGLNAGRCPSAIATSRWCASTRSTLSPRRGSTDDWAPRPTLRRRQVVPLGKALWQAAERIPTVRSSIPSSIR